MEANGSGPKARLDPRAGKGPALGIGKMRKMVVGKKQREGEGRGRANLQQAAPAERHPSPAPLAKGGPEKALPQVWP